MNPRTLINQASSLIAARIIKDSITFLLMLWLARTDQSGFGLLSFGVGLSFLVLAFLDLGLDQYLLREYSKKQEPPLELLNTLLRLRAFLGLALTAGVAVVLALQSYGLNHMVLILGICLTRVMESCAESLLNVYRARGRQVLEAWLSTAALLAGAAFGALLFLLGRGSEAVVLFLVIYAGLRLALVTGAGLRNGLLAGVTLRPLFPLGAAGLADHGRGLLVLVAVYLCGTFFNRVQPLFLKQYQGLTEVALFGSSYDLTGGVLSIISLLILGRVVFPRLVATLGRSKAEFQAVVGAHLQRLVLVGAALTFFFFLRGGPLLVLIYGPDYAGAALPVQILACSLIPSLINNYLVLVWLAEGRYRLLLWSHGGAALSSLVLGFFLVPPLGPQGAALNLFISRAIMTLLFLVAAQRSYGLLCSSSNLKALAGPFILMGTYLGLAGWNFLWAVRISLSLYALWLWTAYFRRDLMKEE